MVETISIFLQFILIYLILSLNIFLFNVKNYRAYGFNLFPKNISFNIIIFLNLILIISFFNVALDKIILIYLFYISVLLTMNIKNFRNISYFNANYCFNMPLLLISSCVIFLEIANNLVLGWDTQMVWIYKTLNFYNGYSIENLSNMPKPNYPYLGTLTWAFFWEISISEHEYFGRLFYVFCFLVSVLLFISNLKINNYYKILLFIFFIIISYDYTYFVDWGIFSGYQEILIFCLVTKASYFFYELYKNKNYKENFFILSILLICNLLIWIKQEGFVISLSFILGLLFFYNISVNKKIVIIISYILILLTRIFIFEYYNLNPLDYQHESYQEFSITKIYEKISLERVLTVIKFLIIEIFANYLIILSLLITFFYVIKIKIAKAELRMISLFFFLILFNIIIFSGIFIVTDVNLVWILKYGLDRIIYQISPLSFYLITVYINHNRIKSY